MSDLNAELDNVCVNDKSLEGQTQSPDSLSQWLWDEMKSARPLSPMCKAEPDFSSYLDMSASSLYGPSDSTYSGVRSASNGARGAGESVAFRTSAESASEKGGMAPSPDAHKSLERLAESRITDPTELAKFKSDMVAFEKRASEQQPPLSSSEISKTYHQIERLLEAKNNPDVPLTASDRVKLAEQVMDQAARPASIDQGYHDTCTVTAIEARTYTRSPSEAARLVADVATTGKYTDADGNIVKVPPGSIDASDAEARHHPSLDGERSHASQIFQVTAVNTYWESHSYEYTDANGNTKVVPPGKLKYEQVQPTGPDDGGERLVDHSTNPPTVIMDWSVNPPVPVQGPKTDLNDDGAVKEMSDKITGKDDTIYTFHEGYENADGRGATRFDSAQELKDIIVAAQNDGKLPIIMAVYTGKEPFFTDSGGGKAGGSGGWHVVTITGFDAKTGLVNVDNQWGKSVDHQGRKGISVGDLYRASKP